MATDAPSQHSLRTLLVTLALVLGASSVAAAQDEDEPDPRGGDAEPSVPAQTAYVVAVSTSDELEPVAARVGAAARASLRRIDGVRWQQPDQAYLGYTDFMMQRLSRGRERLEAGRQAYLNLELDQAVELLGGAIDDFDVAAPALEDPQDLGDALLFLGASQTFAGQSRAARRTFERLHVQMPHIQPDPNLFNPDVLQRYEQAAPRGGASAGLTIESEPPGAVAYVDFVPRGRTPVTIDGLMQGVHNVRVTRPGATPFVQQVELRRGASEQVNAFLEDVEATSGLSDAVQALATADVEEMQGGPIAEIAMLLELDTIGLIRVSPGGGGASVQLELFVYDVSTGRRVLRMHGPAPTAPGELESSVQRLVASGLEAAFRPQGQASDTETIPAFQTDVTPPDDGPVDGEPAFYEQWWFWAGAGAAVALGVILTLVLTSGGGDDLGSDPGGQVILEF